MNSRQNNNMNLKAETIAYPSTGVKYGVAHTARYTPPATASHSLTFSSQVNYFFCEYFKGLLFVAACSVFILAMPRILTEQGKLKQLLTNSVRRLMDIAGALLGLILTLPLWIVVPIAIKLSSPGPVFYSQTRVGLNRRRCDRRACQQADVVDYRKRERRRVDYLGKLFRVYKFRTMVNDAEKECGAVWASENDTRITRVGQFLRMARIDEIPQFINILLGDMSLVGPRPERPEFVRELAGQIRGYSGRLQVKPGLTGLAQIENGYDSSVSTVVQKVKWDLTYIKSRSILTDIKIILKTFGVVFTGKGAR